MSNHIRHRTPLRNAALVFHVTSVPNFATCLNHCLKSQISRESSPEASVLYAIRRNKMGADLYLTFPTGDLMPLDSCEYPEGAFVALKPSLRLWLSMPERQRLQQGCELLESMMGVFDLGKAAEIFCADRINAIKDAMGFSVLGQEEFVLRHFSTWATWCAESLKMDVDAVVNIVKRYGERAITDQPEVRMDLASLALQPQRRSVQIETEQERDS